MRKVNWFGAGAVLRAVAIVFIMAVSGCAPPPPQHCIFMKSGTVAVAATTTPFVAKDHFAVNTKKDAAVKISQLSINFKSWFLGKTEMPFTGSTLYYRGLGYGDESGEEIGGEKYETTLAELFSLIEKQPNGESGTLITDGYDNNIFYVRDVNGVLRVVKVLWLTDGGGWSVYAGNLRKLRLRWSGDWGGDDSPLPLADQDIWNDGDQVFSHNSHAEAEWSEEEIVLIALIIAVTALRMYIRGTLLLRYRKLPK